MTACIISALITNHVWRPRPHGTNRHTNQCEFMNCRRPIGEHARSVSHQPRSPR